MNLAIIPFHNYLINGCKSSGENPWKIGAKAEKLCLSRAVTFLYHLI